MPSQQEIPLGARAFRGVNVAQEPAFLSPMDLQASENWVPSDLTQLLTKRRGVRLYRMLGSTIETIDVLLRTYDKTTNRLLYWVERSDMDQIAFTKNEGTRTVVTNGAFAVSSSLGRRYGMAVLGNKLYVSNGDATNDPYLKVIDLATPEVAVNLGALGVTDETGQSAVVAAGPLPIGTYTYAWAVFDPATGFYVSRGVEHPVVLTIAGQITFTAPNGTGLTGLQVYHLFVTLPNLPIEFATSQVDNAGLAPSSVTVVTLIRTDLSLVPLDTNVVRVGRFLVVHRGTLFLAGDLANPSLLYQTAAIVPGDEQVIFNLGDFFPAFAVEAIHPADGDEITGLGVVALSTTQESPSAPLAIFKNFSTDLLLGDINDPNNPGTLIQISRRIGCIAHATIVSTPAGLIFCGHESVYLLPPSFTEPVDIGWPIQPIIRGIAEPNRARCFAIYHNGFYKLYLVPKGGTDVTQSWWLDLHRQTIDDPPSWWGPHNHSSNALLTPKQLQATCATVGTREVTEPDRAWLAGEVPMELGSWDGTWTGTWEVGGIVLVLLDQSGAFSDGGSSIIASRLRMAMFDANRPFQRKLFTGIRVNARAAAQTTLSVSVFYEHGLPSIPPSIMLAPDEFGVWNGVWSGTWGGGTVFSEGDTRLLNTMDREPHLSAEVVLTHQAAVQVDLRDFELRYIPIERQVA